MDKLDIVFLDRVKQPIIAVWNMIGSDAERLCKTNREALEMCIDADRLLTFGFPLADLAITSAVRDFTFSEVIAFIGKHIKLI